MRVAIIGLGLVGGSLGMALKRTIKTGLDIVGFALHPETLELAKDLGAISRTASSSVEAARGADIVILSTPVLDMKETLQVIGPHLSPGCIVTDTASTKVQIMAWAQEYLPPHVAFIGGHPMAGKETRGIKVAEPTLFRGCHYCLTPSPSATPEAVRQMVSLVKQIGAEPYFIDAAEHDHLVAAISHLPALLSVALVSLTSKSPSWTKMSDLAASGYRDVSRLASGDPRMMRDICLSNRDNIVAWIDGFIEELGQMRSLLAQEKALEEALARAKEVREDWLRRKV